jgi:hypothetical protein
MEYVEYIQARTAVDQQIAIVKNTSSTLASKDLEKEAAVLGALAARESAESTVYTAGELVRSMDALRETAAASGFDLEAKVQGLAELMAASEKHLSAVIKDFTIRADKGTARLVRATWFLTGAAIVAALIGLYGMLNVRPEIITVTAPATPPPIIVTPAPVIAPPVPARAAPR